MIISTRGMLGTLSLLAVTASLSAQGMGSTPSPTPTELQPAGPTLKLGPVDGLTTAWHTTPAHFAVPQGSVLSFEFDWAEPHLLEWTGALPVSMNATTTVAQAMLDDLGPHEIGVTAVAPGGGLLQGWLLEIDVLPREAFHADLPLPDLFAWESDIDPNQPLLAGHEAGHPVLLGRGPRMAVSAGQPVGLSLTEAPEALLPLLEWRLDGEALGIGPSSMVELDEPGTALLEVGPPTLASQVQLNALETNAVGLSCLLPLPGGLGVACVGCPPPITAANCTVDVVYAIPVAGGNRFVLRNNGNLSASFDISVSIVSPQIGCTAADLNGLAATLNQSFPVTVTLAPGQFHDIWSAEVFSVCRPTLRVTGSAWVFGLGVFGSPKPLVCERKISIGY